MTAARYSRRSLLGLIAAAGGVALAGCNSAPAAPVADKATEALPAAKKMLVYRDPECGCCTAWAEIAQKAGYEVTVESRPDMPEIKVRHGVPAELASCHTVIVAGYVLEGHVPMRHIDKLLRDKPRDIVGLAVPGMPRGSPGMEMPDGSVDAFDVMAFDAKGLAVVYTA
ncbi:DUF411 domain-containing protein [Sphingopyxis witflariensis]|uniref:Metal-binding protein n=1 Tax=Sphingopyxis witflariensis TaxID=173675 RepID=A0A246K550_9SPHN|nr:DUF411 domain-containing protein [Sphingopyxis witflariensis]OWR01126.1 hypothetical protein CDQ91_01485 [Sphingopyxis witflariensis]